LRKLGYYFFKYWIAIGLFFYYKKIRMVGLENIPVDKPVLFLSNHQNALLDILPIATRSNRKPWYLTRGDIFENQFIKPLYEFLQMIPIYRIRDGKSNLAKNGHIFDTCGQLLNNGEAILLFPEANHSLIRKVRPLSKGFTRIIDAALRVNPNMDLQLVPIGQNYQTPGAIGDSRSIYFGKPIAVKDFKERTDFVTAIKHEVFTSLTTLTTHIKDDVNYENIIVKLKEGDVDFTNPKVVNGLMAKNEYKNLKKVRSSPKFSVAGFLFRMVNLPFVFLWRLLVKPKVPEPEFEATFRFGFSLLMYTLVYIITFFLLNSTFEFKTACLIIIGHAALNLFLVKIGITSSVQRK